LKHTQVTFAAVVLVFASTGLASAAGCTHPQSIEILRALGPENSIEKALDILKKRKANVRMTYKADGHERKTVAEKLPSLKYQSLEVSVYSNFPGGFIVTYTELLSLSFSSQGVLTDSSCRKFGTGP